MCYVCALTCFPFSGLGKEIGYCGTIWDMFLMMFFYYFLYNFLSAMFYFWFVFCHCSGIDVCMYHYLEEGWSTLWTGTQHWSAFE